jgi:microsomal prostaglandin-E synthase 1
MSSLTTNPSFLIYSATMVVLCLNILALWGYSGAVRAKSKTTPNREDPGTVAKGASVADVDPPEVARVLRAHRNAADNILPFGILALLLVVWGASPMLTGILCGTFVFARLAHTLTYLGEVQPWRTRTFVIGGVATLVMIGFLVRSLIAAS